MDMNKLGKGFWAWLAKRVNRELAMAVDQYTALAPLVEKIITAAEHGGGEITLYIEPIEDDMWLHAMAIKPLMDTPKAEAVAYSINLTDLFRRD
ncbi:MAG: hypothetical protein KAT70_04280 [Thermoplasmata archaeon]|nr:hypothetical protein [Thermoplasmata archaeon]